jgi:hypothetical protein
MYKAIGLITIVLLAVMLSVKTSAMSSAARENAKRNEEIQKEIQIIIKSMIANHSSCNINDPSCGSYVDREELFERIKEDDYELSLVKTPDEDLLALVKSWQDRAARVKTMLFNNIHPDPRGNLIYLVSSIDTNRKKMILKQIDLAVANSTQSVCYEPDGPKLSVTCLTKILITVDFSSKSFN